MDPRSAEDAFLAKLRELELTQTPAEKIVERPDNPLWLHAADHAQLAEWVCRNVYWYGINGNPPWIWDVGSAGNPTGEELARGETTMTNCGGFNATALWIGHNVLGIPVDQFGGNIPDANDSFITRAGTQGIDRHWHGNVCTRTQDFAQLGAYFFKGHSYCRFNPNKLDASTNTINFKGKTDLYWCELELANGKNSEANGRAFRVKQVHHPTVIPGRQPYCLVSHKCLLKFLKFLPTVAANPPKVTQGFVQSMPPMTGHNYNWPSMLLVSFADLTLDFLEAVELA